MIKSAAGKVMWVGRATVFLVGLAVILALVFGAASTVSAHTGDKGFFHLGHKNVSQAVNTLVKKGAGPALKLQVGSGPPLAVNSSEKVANLNADGLDGVDSADLLPGGTLPAGATIRGAYEIDGNASAGGNLVGGDSMSFVYTLPSEPVVRFVPQGATPTAECPGIAPSPQAAPGFLCVYEQARVNLNSAPIINTVERSGGHLYANAAAAGVAYGYGKWAVTAPTPSEAQVLARTDGDAIQQRREP